MTTLTAEVARQVLDYDPVSGAFLWRARPATGGMAGWNGRCAGKSACKLGADGYLRIRYYGKGHYAHRVAWLIANGEEPPPGFSVDHINGDRSDNRIANLRLATDSQQKANARRKVTNTSGFKGVSPTKSGMWQARIVCNRRAHYLGTFSAPEAAHKAYSDAAHRLFGEFARVA